MNRKLHLLVGAAVVAGVIVSGCSPRPDPVPATEATTSIDDQGGSAPSGVLPRNTPTAVLPPATGGELIVGGSVESGPNVTGIPATPFETPVMEDQPSTKTVTLTMADNGRSIDIMVEQEVL